MKFQEWYTENKHRFKNMTQWNMLLASYNNGVLEGTKLFKPHQEDASREKEETK